MTTEQRVHPRVPGGFHGNWYRAPKVSALDAGDGIVGNLSVGGCFLEAREPLPSGARIRLHLDLPLTGWTWLSSQVLHTHPNRGFGVRFVDLMTRDQETLARAVEHLRASINTPARRDLRATASFETKVWVDRAGGATSVDGRFVVLGAGGAFLELAEPYPLGTMMRVRFTLASIGEIDCRAIVRNGLEAKGVGVEFLDLDPHDQERIRTFVEQQG